MAIKAIEICRVSRLNQGFHHPTYNPNGSKLASDGKKWYETAVSFTSISDCFSGEKLQTASGYIGTASARPDGLFYDQVSENSITDLRNSSAKVEDYNRLIDREFNKLVAGTYRGSEGEWVYEKQSSIVANTVTTTTLYGGTITYVYQTGTGIGLPDIGSASVINQDIMIMIKGNTKYYFGVYVRRTGEYYVRLHPMYGNVTSDFTIGASYDVVICTKSTRTKSNTLIHTDIIGAPTNYPTAWKRSGVSGVPLVVAEDGTSLLPTGALTVFKLSKKANAAPLQVLKSTDSGTTWTALTVTTHYTFSTTTNAITMVTAPLSTDLIMVTYQTHTNMAVAGVNSEVLAIGGVYAGNYSGVGSAYGCVMLMQSLISKVAIGTGTGQLYARRILNTNNTAGNLSVMEISWSEKPYHDIINLAGNTTSPTVKTFPYLTRSNGKARLQLVFKEMKHNGTSWGDDSKFNIVDNVSTTTDNNAQTVLIGQKYAELPYFISAGE